MYCRACGSELHNDAVVCMKCGVATSNMNLSNTRPEGDFAFAWGILGFFIPIVGLILYLIWKNEKPISSKAAGIGALIRVILIGIIILIYFFIFVLIIGSY